MRHVAVFEGVLFPLHLLYSNSRGNVVTVRRLAFCPAAALLLAAAACSREPQPPAVGVIDPVAFTQLRDFEAYRSSSTSPDSTSNDDSARPLALRHVPSVSEAVGDVLVAHLRDADENVRMVVANAIADHPEVARRGMEALMTAAQVPGEHRHVLRSVATALGAIGPDASEVLPLLRMLAEQPLVRWQAEAAIRRIQGEG